MRTTDTVCRLGGDEFVILLAEMTMLNDATRVAEKLIEAFSAPHVIDGHSLTLSLSIGIALYPEDGLEGDTLMRKADDAMYLAKEGGRNRYQLSASAAPPSVRPVPR